MSEEQKEALEILKGLEFYEYEWYVKTDIFEGHAGEIVEKVEKAIEIIVSLINNQQKEIERLKEEYIGDTKFDKLLFSIRMLHFHNYVNDKQFAEMIKKLSNENKGE